MRQRHSHAGECRRFDTERRLYESVFLQSTGMFPSKPRSPVEFLQITESIKSQDLVFELTGSSCTWPRIFFFLVNKPGSGVTSSEKSERQIISVGR